jgi:hypothetical protein
VCQDPFANKGGPIQGGGPGGALKVVKRNGNNSLKEKYGINGLMNLIN